jgi:glycosyltransferase involved in cell wall biosynthesis
MVEAIAARAGTNACRDIPTMNISVILCTYNRSESLSKALASVAASTLPASIEWEVLVVDNNSNDQTRAVAEGFCRRYPGRFRYIFEPQSGKSHALETGIRNACGNILAFMDDDVTVDPAWLVNLTASLHNGHWGGAGGRILPDCTFSPPRWFPIQDRYALAPLALFDLGTQAGPLTEPPFGTNMAFQKALFEKYGGFRIDLGPRPGSEIRSEDTEFGHRVLAAGEQLRYEPSAVVYHSVSESRVRKTYYLAWTFDKARADIRQYGIPADTKVFIAGIPFYLFRRLIVWAARWIVSIKPSRRFLNKLKTWTVAGQIVECYRRAHGGGDNADEPSRSEGRQ